MRIRSFPWSWAIMVIHVFLVVTDLWLYDLEQIGDQRRFIAVARDLSTFSLEGSHTIMHCHTAPGYPLLLMLAGWPGDYNIYVIGIVQSLLYAGAFYFFLRALYDRGVLTDQQIPWAFAIVLFSPEVFGSNGPSLSESFTSTLLMAVGAGLLTIRRAWYIDMVFVVASIWLFLTRFEYLFILPFLMYVLFKTRRWKTGIALLSFAGLAFHFNALKNQYLFGEYELFSFGGGTVIYGGNNTNLDGSWHIATKEWSYLPEHAVEEYQHLQAAGAVEYCTG